SITRSTRARNCGYIVSPSALAVFMLSANRIWWAAERVRWRSPLLRTCDKRPNHCRADARDELAPPHCTAPKAEGMQANRLLVQASGRKCCNRRVLEG